MGHCIEEKQIYGFLVVLSDKCNDGVTNCKNSKYTALLTWNLTMQ